MLLKNQDSPWITADDVLQAQPPPISHTEQMDILESNSVCFALPVDCRSEAIAATSELPPPHRFHRKTGSGEKTLPTVNRKIVDYASQLKELEYLSKYRRSTGRYLSESAQWPGNKNHVQVIAQYIFHAQHGDN
jgi:hypothetical protein